MSKMDMWNGFFDVSASSSSASSESVLSSCDMASWSRLNPEARDFVPSSSYEFSFQSESSSIFGSSPVQFSGSNSVSNNSPNGIMDQRQQVPSLPHGGLFDELNKILTAESVPPSPRVYSSTPNSSFIMDRFESSLRSSFLSNGNQMANPIVQRSPVLTYQQVSSDLGQKSPRMAIVGRSPDKYTPSPNSGNVFVFPDLSSAPTYSAGFRSPGLPSRQLVPVQPPVRLDSMDDRSPVTKKSIPPSKLLKHPLPDLDARIRNFTDPVLRASRLGRPRRESTGSAGNGCVFCKNNNEEEEIYKSHILKGSDGIIICPILRAYKCPICLNEGGDQAHTRRYCPKNREFRLREALNGNNGSPPGSSASSSEGELSISQWSPVIRQRTYTDGEILRMHGYGY